MRLVTFDGGFGRVEGDRVLPMGPDLVRYLATGEAADGEALALADVRLLAPVPRPGKVIGIGLNYRDHAAESGQPIPTAPILFPKFANSVIGPGEAIVIPPETEQPDYEAELGVVIGRTAHRVPQADALSYVAGYATGNDFTARDLQFDTGGQWLIGKTPDQFAPLGPYLVTAEQVNPDDLAIECRVNGETRQASSTNDLIFGTRQVIAYCSRIMTLRPGDVIFTGTPQGVIQGKPKEERVWLKRGDRIACSVEKLGELRFALT